MTLPLNIAVPDIVSMEQAREHIKLAIGGSPEDADLRLKLNAATGMICRYIADQQPYDRVWVLEIESWSQTGSPSAPEDVQLAILEQVTEFFRFRGDDPPGDRPQVAGYLTPAIANLLMAYRAPKWA